MVDQSNTKHVGNKYQWPERCIDMDPRSNQVKQSLQDQQPTVPEVSWTDGIGYPHHIQNLKIDEKVRVKWPAPTEGKQRIIGSRLITFSNIICKVICTFLWGDRNEAIINLQYDVKPDTMTWIEADFSFQRDRNLAIAANDYNRQEGVFVIDVVSVKQAPVDFAASAIQFKIWAKGFYGPERTEKGFLAFKKAGYHKHEIVENYVETVHTTLEKPKS